MPSRQLASGQGASDGSTGQSSPSRPGAVRFIVLRGLRATGGRRGSEGGQCRLGSKDGAGSTPGEQ